MKLTIKQQLMLMLLGVAITMVIVGGNGYIGTTRENDVLVDTQHKMDALRSQMEADMLHDSIRADVMEAMYASAMGDSSQHGAMLRDFEQHADMFQEDIDNVRKLDVAAEINEALNNVAPALARYTDDARNLINLANSDPMQAQARLPDFVVSFDALAVEMENFSNVIERSADDTAAAAAIVSDDAIRNTIMVMAAALIAMAIAGFAVLRGIMNPIGQLHGALLAIRKGSQGDSNRLNGFHGEFSQVQVAFNNVLDDIEARRAEEGRRASAAFRVQQALGAATTNAVLTDANLQVIYVNNTAMRMFGAAEKSIRATVPGFSANEMVGRSLGALIVDSSVIAAMHDLQQPRQDTIKLGDRSYRITSTMVRDDSGARLGVFCEWVDMTEQFEAERQIESVLSDAINGKLDARLDTRSFQGFMRALAESMNSMLDAIVTPLRTTAHHLRTIAEGHIPDQINGEFKGDFNEMLQSLNTCCKVLKSLINDTTSMVDAASRGRLDQRVDVENHWGDYRRIVEGMNNTFDAVAQPVSEVKEVMSGLASGDLTKRMSSRHQGDFAVLSEAVNASVENLVGMVRKIHVATDSLNTAAGEISIGNQNLSNRTMEQAGALEETNATMHTVTARAEDNNNSTNNANKLAQFAVVEARKGGETVNNAVRAMSEISIASKRIAEIIGVIDSIAFQTNLLALNASVEAARAGEEGRGFAVVANEVRALASRSAKAAHEIKELINDTVGKVEHGSKLVNDSGSTLLDIIDSINKVGVIISEISTAIHDQMGGFQEVNRAIAQLDSMTQQNAALVEEAAAASESMAEQSNTLRDLVSFFRLENGKVDNSGMWGKSGARPGTKLRVAG